MKKGILAIMLSILFFSQAVYGDPQAASNILITKIVHARDDVRGTNGRAYIFVDTAFSLNTLSCLYSGTISPALEIDTTHGSYNGMLSLAISAYMSGKKIDAYYDDGFGSGTTCRLLSLTIHN